MSKYKPNGFVILKITNEDEVLYKVFGSWSGGYLDSDEWRVNSGITGVHEDEEGFLHIKGYSRSTYVINPRSEGRLSAYTSAALRHLLDTWPKTEVVTLEELKENFNV